MKFQCQFCHSILESGGEPGSQVRCSNCGRHGIVPVSNLEPGCVIGDFILECKIGQGSSGIVFRALQISLNRPVALKVLRDTLVNREELEFFLREARSAAAINHVNIVQSYAVGEDDGIFYLAMNLIDGESLRARLERIGHFEVDEALHIIQQMAEALSYAWEMAGIIHRDVKPDNVMITNDGIVKLTDLGLAVSEKSPYRHDVSGSPAYMSPEQFAGGEITICSDMYSLGIILFQLLSGKLPFESKDIGELAMQHFHGDVPDLNRMDAQIPKIVANFVNRLLDKFPDGRFRGYDELLHEIWQIRQQTAPVSEMVQSVHTVSINRLDYRAMQKRRQEKHEENKNAYLKTNRNIDINMELAKLRQRTAAIQSLPEGKLEIPQSLSAELDEMIADEEVRRSKFNGWKYLFFIWFIFSIISFWGINRYDLINHNAFFNLLNEFMRGSTFKRPDNFAQREQMEARLAELEKKINDNSTYSDLLEVELGALQKNALFSANGTVQDKMFFWRLTALRYLLNLQQRAGEIGELKENIAELNTQINKLNEMRQSDDSYSKTLQDLHDQQISDLRLERDNYWNKLQDAADKMGNFDQLYFDLLNLQLYKLLRNYDFAAAELLVRQRLDSSVPGVRSKLGEYQAYVGHLKELNDFINGRSGGLAGRSMGYGKVVTSFDGENIYFKNDSNTIAKKGIYALDLEELSGLVRDSALAYYKQNIPQLAADYAFLCRNYDSRSILNCMDSITADMIESLLRNDIYEINATAGNSAGNERARNMRTRLLNTYLGDKLLKSLN